MLKIIGALALCMLAQFASAEDPATSDATAKPEPASQKAATAEPVAAADKEEKEFVPPPGFKTKKRGDQVLYCQRDATVGTRFKTEKCYNEEQLRTYIMVTEAQRRDMDRIRTNCGGGPCTPFEPSMPSR